MCSRVSTKRLASYIYYYLGKQSPHNLNVIIIAFDLLFDEWVLRFSKTHVHFGITKMLAETSSHETEVEVQLVKIILRNWHYLSVRAAYNNPEKIKLVDTHFFFFCYYYYAYIKK